MLPTLSSEKITLVPFTLADAPLVQRFAGDPKVAATTLNVPHPYPEGAAATWIATHEPQFLERKNVCLSIRSPEGELVGAINLALNLSDLRGELGYWIAAPFWNNGFCTDAARRLIRFGFEELNLNKICAHHLAINPASGRVMGKAGMRQEGVLLKHVIKNGQPLDIVLYGLLREDYHLFRGNS